MGGQAVLEGVMMRGPRAYAVAVRRPQGDILLISHPFQPLVSRKGWLRFPIVRGAVSLVEMLVLGYKSLDYSANVAGQAAKEIEEAQKAAQAAKEMEEARKAGRDAPAVPDSIPAEKNPASPEPAASAQPPASPQPPASAERPIGPWAMAGVFAISMGLAMLLFVALPNAATHLLGLLSRDGLIEERQPLLYNLVAGFVRVCVIVAYIWGISLFKDIRRLFQYHGAEHKVVMAYEQRQPLNLERIRPMTTVHPRCGTTFIAVVILVSIIIFAILAALILRVYPPFGGWSIWLRKTLLIALHILFMPLVAGIAFEITRRAGKRPDFWLYRFLLLPGLAFQRITTRQPDDAMIEVALRAFFAVLEPEQLALIPEEEPGTTPAEQTPSLDAVPV